MASKASILYLYQHPMEIGFEYMACRKLVETLSKDFELTPRFAIYSQKDIAAIKYEGLKRQIISEEDVLSHGYDVILIENTLGFQEGKSNKVSSEFLSKFLETGKIAIFLFGGGEINELINRSNHFGLLNYNNFLQNAKFPIIQQALSEEEFPDRIGRTYVCGEEFNSTQRYIKGYDEINSVGKGKSYYFYYIDVNDEYKKFMRKLNPFTESILKDVSRIVVCNSLQLNIQSVKGILVGNHSTRMIAKGDFFWDGNPIHTFGVYRDFGLGCAALITGDICTDSIVNEYATDSIQLLVNLVNTLLSYQKERHQILDKFGKEDYTEITKHKKFILGEAVQIEETRYHEFKEVKGGNAVDSIKGLADQYAVAFLNSEGGRIYWGIRDEDRVAVGVKLTYSDRDEIRRVVTEKLMQIQPSIAPTAYRIEMHPVYKLEDEILDLVVVELVVPRSSSKDLYSNGKGEVYIKTDGGKRKLTIPEIQAEVLRRNKN